jgi:hypothetical protein
MKWAKHDEIQERVCSILSYLSLWSCRMSTNARCVTCLNVMLVLLVTQSNRVRTHAVQTALPGGRMDHSYTVVSVGFPYTPSIHRFSYQ